MVVLVLCVLKWDGWDVPMKATVLLGEDIVAVLWEYVLGVLLWKF